MTIPHESGSDTAVERWIRTHPELVAASGFPSDGYLAERDTTRRLQQRAGESVKFVHIEFRDVALTFPVESGADRVILDGNPGADLYRFNPRGIVVNASQLKSVRLLTAADADELEIPADTRFNKRAMKEC